MIWVKTETGRVELERRTLLKKHSLRALFVLIDGNKSEDVIVRSVPGSTPDDFKNLRELGLIRLAVQSDASTPRAAVTTYLTPRQQPFSPADHKELVARLRKLISDSLGLAGFSLTVALDKAQTLQDLALVARRTLEQVQERHGPQAGAIAREALRRLVDY